MIETLKSFLAALIFYTTFPLPYLKNLSFTRLARWSPIIGIIIGLLLKISDQLLVLLHFPSLIRSGIIIAIWILITGGLHLDGVMDTADGLAVLEKERKLTVMQDSLVGAYGMMAAIVLLILKWSALSELNQYRGLGLCLAAGWGRWGQVAAIAFYPYLKPSGKGAFHKKYLKMPQDILLGLIVLILISLSLKNITLISLTVILGSAIALVTGFYFARQLGGHTGDSYGAVVEWTETLFLCSLVPLLNTFL